MARRVELPDLSKISNPENNGLLCVTINPDETLVIGNQIAIRAGKKGNHMVMRISAPKDLRVERVPTKKEVVDENSLRDIAEGN